MSRYPDGSAINKYKRCIECNQQGHFKCTSERESRKVKLSFRVEENLDEFFTEDGAIDDFIMGSPSQLGKGATAKQLSKRDKKMKRKKKQKMRRVPGSNLMIPASDDESSSSSSSESGSHEDDKRV